MKPSLQLASTLFFLCALVLIASQGLAHAQTRERLGEQDIRRVPVERAFAVKQTEVSIQDIQRSSISISEKLDRASSQLRPQENREILKIIDEANAELKVLEDKSTAAVQQRDEAVDAKETFFTLLTGSVAVNLLAIIGIVIKFPLLERRYKKLLIAEKEAELKSKNIL